MQECELRGAEIRCQIIGEFLIQTIPRQIDIGTKQVLQKGKT
jgi:hypothetical protein